MGRHGSASAIKGGKHDMKKTKANHKRLILGFGVLDLVSGDQCAD